MSDMLKTRISADEFFQLPETNTPLELIDGQVIMSPSPTPYHQDTAGSVYILLKQIARLQGGRAFIAPLDVYLDESNVPQPDVLWLAPDSQCKVEAKRLVGAPDLIVEVLSPGTAREDKRVKFRLYEKFGVREYWIVDPHEQLVDVWQQNEASFVLLDVFSPGETFLSRLVGSVEVKTIFTE